MDGCDGELHPLTRLFLQLFANPLTFYLRKVVHEQLALQMIHLVLDADTGS